MCQWFALCERPPVGVARHPSLDVVPVCERCAERFGLVVIPPEAVEEIVASVEVVEAHLRAGAVGVTYVASGDVVERYGSETVTAIVRGCLRLGTQVMGGGR